MATVINNPAASTDTTSGAQFLLTVVLLAVLAFAVLYYGVPALRGRSQMSIPSNGSQPAQQQAPASGPTSGGANSGSSTNLNVPDKIDVNLNGTK